MRFIFILVVLNMNIAVSQNNSLIYNKWILSSSQMGWNSIIVPQVLSFDFEKQTIQTYEFDGTTDPSVTFSFDKKKLHIGKNIEFDIIEISPKTLRLKLDDKEFTYSPLVKHINDISLVNTISLLTCNHWKMYTNELYFSNENEFPFNNQIKGLKVKEIDSESFVLGSYTLVQIEGNIILITIIDGKYKKNIYQIIEVGKDYIKLLPIEEFGNDYIIKLEKISVKK